MPCPDKEDIDSIVTVVACEDEPDMSSNEDSVADRTSNTVENPDPDGSVDWFIVLESPSILSPRVSPAALENTRRDGESVVILTDPVPNDFEPGKLGDELISLELMAAKSRDIPIG